MLAGQVGVPHRFEALQGHPVWSGFRDNDVPKPEVTEPVHDYFQLFHMGGGEGCVPAPGAVEIHHIGLEEDLLSMRIAQDFPLHELKGAQEVCPPVLPVCQGNRTRG